MITSWLLQRALDWRTYAVIALLAVFGFGVHKVDQHGYNKGYAKAITVDASKMQSMQKQIDVDRDMYAQSVLEASKIQQTWQSKVDSANEDANNAKAKLEILRGDNQRLNDSLHVTTSKANQRISLPDTTKTDITEYTSTLSDVFERCTSEYLKLGEIAQSDAINAKQVIDSYPQSK